jgi:hypothetical protein
MSGRPFARARRRPVEAPVTPSMATLTTSPAASSDCVLLVPSGSLKPRKRWNQSKIVRGDRVRDLRMRIP